MFGVYSTKTEELFYNLYYLYTTLYNQEVKLDYDKIPDRVEITVPIYGKITIDKHILYISTLPIFERLSNIMQLGYTFLKHTGATHTRYEHSLGVYYLTQRIYKKLLEKQPEIFDEKDHIIIDLASLLHDIGHPGLGHAIDGTIGPYTDLLIKVYKSDDRLPINPKINKLDITISTFLLRNNYQLKNAIREIVRKELDNRYDDNLFIDIIAAIISEEAENFPFRDANVDYNKFPKIKIFQEILGREIDTDRIDYVLRDQHHAHLSVLLGNDFRNLINEIESKVINMDVDISISEDNHIKINKDFKTKVDKIRDMLYEYLYENIPRSAVDSMLTRIVYSFIISSEYLYKNTKIPPEDFLNGLAAYFLMEPDTLNIFTRTFLENLIKEAIIFRLEGPLEEFVRRSLVIYYIMDYFRVLFILYDILDNILKKYLPNKDITCYYLDIPIYVLNYDIVYKLYYLGIDTFEKIYLTIIKYLETESPGDLYSPEIKAINDMFIEAVMRDMYKVLGIPELESNINTELGSKELIHKPDIKKWGIIILPNYYAFKKILNINKLMTPKDLIEFSNSISEKLKRDFPLAFILFPEKFEDVELKAEKYIGILYDYLHEIIRGNLLSEKDSII